MKRGILLVALLVGVLMCLGFATTNTPIQDDLQGITDPKIEFTSAVTENWSAVLDAAELGVTTALLPNMALADIDPDNPVPNFGPYPHLFKDGDNVSFTMLDRALSQQELVRGQQQLILAAQAQVVSLDALTSAVNNITSELITGRTETAKIANQIEAIVTSGVNVTVEQDNATLIDALQQLLQTLQSDQTF